MWYGFLADGVVAAHVGCVSFIVLGQLGIVVGLVRKWSWVRNLWFRLAHLLAIVIVALEAVWGIDCPLTLWERDLRILAGQEASSETFIGRWLHQLIFYDFPPWVFTACYVSFALLVLVTLVLGPPRWRKEGKREGEKERGREMIADGI